MLQICQSNLDTQTQLFWRSLLIGTCVWTGEDAGSQQKIENKLSMSAEMLRGRCANWRCCVESFCRFYHPGRIALRNKGWFWERSLVQNCPEPEIHESLQRAKKNSCWHWMCSHTRVGHFGCRKKEKNLVTYSQGCSLNVVVPPGKMSRGRVLDANLLRFNWGCFCAFVQRARICNLQWWVREYPREKGSLSDGCLPVNVLEMLPSPQYTPCLPVISVSGEKNGQNIQDFVTIGSPEGLHHKQRNFEK